MSTRVIAIANEHVGFSLKTALVPYLQKAGYDVMDMGVSSDTPVDYPMIAAALSEAVVSGSAEKGILICGTGLGMSIAANKVHGARAALCSDLFSSKMARLHNNANVLCLGAWITGTRLAEEIVQIFLNTPYEGGRHDARLKMISLIEQQNHTHTIGRH
jgi:ribose 5-phosphate isomerase B